MLRLFHTCWWSLGAGAAALMRGGVDGEPRTWGHGVQYQELRQGQEATAPEADRKNVILIIFDDLRAMHESYGWSQPHLPNQERFIKESLTFDAAYVQQAVCGPSRSSFLSGRRPDRTHMWNFYRTAGSSGDPGGSGGFRDAPGAQDWNTLPQHFANNGYYTAGAGKVYHPRDPNGFDPASWTEPDCIGWKFPYFGQGRCPIPEELMADDLPGCPVDTELYKNCTSGEVDCFPDVQTLETGIGFLHKAASQYHKQGQPFFLAFGFVKPHLPFIYPDKYLHYVPTLDEILLPPNPRYSAGAPFIHWINAGFQGHAGGSKGTVPDTQARAFLQGYYAAAAFTDDLLGQLLDEIDRLNLRSSTAVVITSDNGYGLGEHNHWEKYTNFETDTRVPLFVRAPWKTKAAGARTEALVELVDLYPSLAELAGIKVSLSEESIDGQSWVHLLERPELEHKDAVFSQHPRCWGENSHRAKMEKFERGGLTDDVFFAMDRCEQCDPSKIWFMGYTIRTSRWRYIEWALWNGTTLMPNWERLAGRELYDHRGDAPHDAYKSFTQYENQNVASDYPSVVRTLAGKLHSFVASVMRTPA